MWFGTFTCTCTAPWGMVVGTCHLQGRKPLPWGRSPVSFGQIGLGSVFQGKSWDKGPSSLALPRMVHHPWLVAPDMIWHIYSHLYCSSKDGGRDLPSSGEAAPTMGQVSCEFRADRPTGIFQPAAPDVIWHIYSRQHCFNGILGIDLLSSGDVALTRGASPLWVLRRSAKLLFSAGSTWHDLAHLLRAVLLHRGQWYQLAIFREVLLGLGKIPCKSGKDHTKHWDSYPWDVCQGPRPLKSELGRMEQWNVVSSYVTWTLYLVVP